MIRSLSPRPRLPLLSFTDSTAQEKFALGRDFALIEDHPISHPWLLSRCIEHHRAEAVRNAH